MTSATLLPPVILLLATSSTDKNPQRIAASSMRLLSEGFQAEVGFDPPQPAARRRANLQMPPLPKGLLPKVGLGAPRPDSLCRRRGRRSRRRREGRGGTTKV